MVVVAGGMHREAMPLLAAVSVRAFCCAAWSSSWRLWIRLLHVLGETWYVVTLSALQKVSTTWLIGYMRRF